ncbi:hypothetical protein VTH06DRAFT_8339 [Thermothelomyces fergusii]
MDHTKLSHSDRPHGPQPCAQGHGPRHPPGQREAGLPAPSGPRTTSPSHDRVPHHPLAPPQIGDWERLWKALCEPDPFLPTPPPDPPRASARAAAVLRRRNNRPLVPLSPSGTPSRQATAFALCKLPSGLCSRFPRLRRPGGRGGGSCSCP